MHRSCLNVLKADAAAQVQTVYDPPSAPSVAILASYEASEGTRDELGRLKFHDHPDFTPTLTPKQVLHAAV